MAQSTDYMLTSAVECDRLERQADLHGRDRVFDHIHLEPGQWFLDAGCGSGWVARRVAARFPEAHVVGVDLSPDYVAYARERATAEGLTNITFEAGDLQNLSFDDASFDMVWSQFVLYFLPDPRGALGQFRRVTKPGGRVMAALHQLPGGIHPVEPQIRIADVVQLVNRGWRCECLPELFASAGLVDIDLDVQLDRIYSKVIGPLDAPHRRNLEEVLSGPFERLADQLGGPEAARKILDDWLAYLARPDTTNIVTYWVAKGSVPA